MAANPQPRSRNTIENVRLYFTGVAMGIADLIPGVSGGTMAFIMGVYEELLNAIKSVNVEFARKLAAFKWREAFAGIPLAFLIVLGAGIMSAVFSLSFLMSWLLDNQPVFLFSFFFGLILASVIAVGGHVTWKAGTIAAMAIGAVGAFFLVGMVPLDMPHDPLTLFLSGMVAIMAMILPGISGSFILLILGQYDYVLRSVTSLDFLTLIIVGTGAVIGLMMFSRVLSWLLARYHAITVAVLIGFMIGSLRVIWPWKVVLETRIDRHGEEVPIAQANILPDFASAEFWVALLLCLSGFALVSALDHGQSGNNPIIRLFNGRRRDVRAA